MSVNYTEYYVQLVNARTKKTIDDDTGLFIVLKAGEAQPAVIYSDDDGTAITYTAALSANTMTDGIIQFWTDSSVTSVDLTIVTATGHSVFVAGLTPSQHRVEVNQEEIRQVMVSPYYASIQGLTATGSVWANGLSVPAKSVVHDCYIRTTVLGTTSSLDVGLSGDPNGLIQLATSAVTGFHYPEMVISLVTATCRVGALLVGTNATNTSNRRSHINPTISAIVWQDATSTVLAAAAGYIYVVYDLFQTA
jgi:hypothetical protein